MIESTIVQSGALYFMQHKAARSRSKTRDFARQFFSAQRSYRPRTSKWWQLSRLIPFTGIMKPLPFTTSENEENTAQSRWDGEGGNSGELPALAVTNQEGLVIPLFASTEQAMRWGSHLNAEQHTTLVKAQRALSQDALAEPNPQRMVNLATRSQLLREAAEAFTESRG
jgi:uncharacterized membrane protein YccC